MQALIITAYKDEDGLTRLLNSTYEYFNIYLHIDKKATISLQRIIDKYPQIYCISKYNVYWGSFNHLKAIVDLLNMAVNDNNSFFHIISGQDILVKPLKEFDRFENDKSIYLNFLEYESWDTVVRERLKNWVFSSNIKCRNPFDLLPNRIIRKIQKTFFLERKTLPSMNVVYKGLIWGSFPLCVAEYIINYIAIHPEFMRSLAHTHVPEEFFLQSIIGNSHYRNLINTNDLRYCDWSTRNGSRPAYLDETDFEKIISSNKCFARKIDSQMSCDLIRKIQDYLNCNL